MGRGIGGVKATERRLSHVSRKHASFGLISRLKTQRVRVRGGEMSSGSDIITVHLTLRTSRPFHYI